MDEQTAECISKRALRRARDRERKRRARQDPALRAAEAARRKARRQDPSLRAEEIEVKRRRREDPAVRAAEAAAQRRRREDPATRAAEIEAQRRRREDPAVRASEAEAQRRRREDPAVRAAENRAQRRRREDPAVRAAEARANRERYAKAKGAKNACAMLLRDGPFGYSCSVCDRLWFSLAALPADCHAVLEEDFPTADLTTFHLCDSCLRLVSKGQVPTLSTSNRCRHPVKPPDLQPFNREPSVPNRRLKDAAAVDGIATLKERPNTYKKHSAKSKGTSTSSSMRGRSTQTEVCVKTDRVTQTARLMLGQATQT
ncbi:uncharacterized protein LOC144128151 isoform X1 [Amblyomma americanum]